LDNLKDVQSLKSILVTSTRANYDGSSIAADMAAIIAHNGKRVALVDADLRRPLLHHLFNLPNRVGLMDILHGERALSGIMHSVNSNHLFVLTAGVNNNGKTDPFASLQTTELLTQLKMDYDKVIIHGPPFFYPETVSLAAKMDGVVLLIHPNRARTDSTRPILDRLQRSGAKIIGVVMRDQPRYQVNQSSFIDKLLTYDRRARSTH